MAPAELQATLNAVVLRQEAPVLGHLQRASVILPANNMMTVVQISTRYAETLL